MNRLIILALLLTFMICYLEWPNHAAFIFQMEYELFFGSNDVVGSFSHPLILFPFAGQVLLLITVFLKNPKRYLVLIGALMLSPLVFMILLTGLLSLNWKVIISTLPFILAFIAFVRAYRSNRIKTPLTI